MPLMEISIVPIGTKTTSLSGYVAEALKTLRNKKGIRYQLTAMGTIVEADSLDRLLEVAKKMHKATFKAGAQRVLMTAKIDDRKDKRLSIRGKVESVEKRVKI